MSAKYIFYDLETTGRGKKESPNAFSTTPKWEQIMQIAAIVTDENFQETNQNINEFCRPRTSIISQPGALLTTQNGIREALHAEQSSYELMKKINSTFDEWKKLSNKITFRNKAFINGKFVDSVSKKTFDSINPATEEIITPVAECNEKDIDAAVKAARTSYEKGYWSKMPPAERKAILLKLAE